VTGIPLFIAEPAGTCQLSLRRFRYGDEAGHRHDATAVIDEDAPETPRSSDGLKGSHDARIPQDDPRWPGTCGCGEAFTGEDEWQVNELSWYQGGGNRFAWGIGSWDGPPGAMIRAPWRDDSPDNGCPAYIVFLPNGSCWCTRDQSSGPGRMLGPQWTITGTPPAITVAPSIDDRGARPWHGWIRAGELVAA
jgi:Family of unknown function (DUF6527)